MGAGLKHPAIPEFIDYFREDQEDGLDTDGPADDALFCLAQRYAPGLSLEQQLERGWRPTDDEVVEVAAGERNKKIQK